MVKKQPFAIFYLEANKAFFYGSNITATVQLDIPTDTLAYLDVVNRDKFYQIIQNFVTTNKIEPASVVILFSAYASYEKEVTGKLPDEINNDIQQFLDSVPYERVLSRIYKMQDKIRVVATNKDMYEVIKHAFEKVHFPTVAVASLPLLQKMLPDLGNTIKMELIATKLEAIKQYSFITLDEINNSGRSRIVSMQENSEKPNPLRLYGLIGVFVVLVGILVYAIMTQLTPPKKTVATPIVVHKKRIITPTPSLTPVIQNSVGSPSSKLNIVQPQSRAKSNSVIQ